MTSLKEKLCLTAIEHFSLVLEHVKSLKRNKLTLLDHEQTLVKVNILGTRDKQIPFQGGEQKTWQYFFPALLGCDKTKVMGKK